MSAPIDITGRKYGRLTALNYTGHTTANGQRIWRCLCECGNYIEVRLGSLQSGNTKSCGCLFHEMKCEKNQENKQVQIGNIYGKLTVIKSIGLRGTSGRRRHWSICQCECGNIVEVADNSLQQGKVQSCGCLNSKGEAIICKILDENNIIYEHDKTFKPLTEEVGRALRFDFIIYNKDQTINRFVEFDGIQHTGKTQIGPEPYEILYQKDNLKNQFCLSHGYILIRIPYSKKETLTLEDIMEPNFMV